MTDFWNWWWHSSNHRFKTSRIYFFHKIFQQRFLNNNSSFSFEGGWNLYISKTTTRRGAHHHHKTTKTQIFVCFFFFCYCSTCAPHLWAPPVPSISIQIYFNCTHFLSLSLSRKYDVIKISMRAVLPTHMMARNCLSFIQTGARILLDNGLYIHINYIMILFLLQIKMKNFGEGRFSKIIGLHCVLYFVF
jgi:hypothetical protein